MTGYVRPCKARLGGSDWETYQAAYCGVCRALGRRYGQAYRCLLSYDLVFYALLLAREPFQEHAGRCAAHPVKRRRMAEGPNPALDTAADATVLLAYGQVRDHAEDKGSLGRAAARVGLSAMKKAYKQAALRLPGTASVMEAQMERLRQMEKDNTGSLDRPADTFAKILAALAEGGEGNPTERRVRAEVLRHLGRWIYLTDAADDLEDDLSHKRYNPIAARYGLDSRMPDEVRDGLRTTLGRSREASLAAFDLGGPRAYTAILENILTAGLWAAESRVLGTARQAAEKEG